MYGCGPDAGCEVKDEKSLCAPDPLQDGAEGEYAKHIERDVGKVAVHKDMRHELPKPHSIVVDKVEGEKVVYWIRLEARVIRSVENLPNEECDIYRQYTRHCGGLCSETFDGT